MKIMNIKDDQKIIQWFNIKESGKGTQITYLGYMKKFCECVGKSPTELIKEAQEETRKGLLLSEMNTMVYISKYKQCMKDLAPKSQSLGMAVVKSFYDNFDIPLSSSIKRQKKTVPKRENQNFLKKEDIEKMITYAKNSRDKAIFFCMATSGMALQEITNLKMSDITFSEDGISIISIRRKKANRDLVTFISPEATQAVKAYIDERNRDPELSIKGKNDYVFVTYIKAGRHPRDKGGRISGRAFTKIFKDLGDELGYENGKDFVKTRSHALRKFFTSTLESAGFPKPKVDFMVGHALNGVDLAYYNRDPTELKELYMKYLQHLTFFKKIVEVRSLDTKDAQKLDNLEKENLNLKVKIAEIEKEKGTEIAELKKDMESIKRALEIINKLPPETKSQMNILKIGSIKPDKK